MLQRFLAPLLRRVPSRCAVCHAWPARLLCDDCVQRFAQPENRCRRCALSVPAGVEVCAECLRAPPPLDACVAAVDYAFPWAGCIGQFKFEQHTEWAAPLATLLRHTPWAEPLLEEADAVVPVPLSAQRLMQRGYNQCALLARELAPTKRRTDWLLRVQDHTPQADLPREQRLRNVAHAFAAHPAAVARIAGQRLLLIDDVMTTGATLHAAARALRHAGASTVSALVLARTPPHV